MAKEKVKEKTEELTEKNLPVTVKGFLWFFVKRHKTPFVLIFAMGVLFSSTRIFWPYANKLIIDVFESYIEAGRPQNKLIEYIGWVILLYIGIWSLGTVLKRGQYMLRGWFHPIFKTDIYKTSLAYIQKHSHNFFTENYAGSTVRRLINLGDCSTELMIVVYEIVATTFVFLTAFALFLTIRWEFCLVCSVWAAAHLGYCAARSGKWNVKARESAAAKGMLIGKIMDGIINISNIRIFAKEKQELEYLDPFFRKSKEKSEESHRIVNKDHMILGFFCTFFMLIPTFWLIVKFYKADEIGVGDIVFILGAAEMLIARVFELGQQIGNFSEQSGMLKQSLSIISAPIDIKDMPDAKPIEIKEAEIAFHNVTFAYPDGKDNPLFKNLSLTIKPKEKVGIVGQSGAGKSSMIHLLLRYFDVDEGMIRIDGQDIKDVTQTSLRENIAFVPQDTTLFHRTVWDNIKFGREDAAEEDVVKAAKRGGAHDFIKRLPEGYKTEIGEKGLKLSTGQRQRLSITRALLKDAPILVLDEATSALDSETEEAIQKSLEELMKKRTTIAIAHRLSTLRNMDRIIVLEDGKIVEEGTHKALLTKKGIYAKLWSMQSGGFIQVSDNNREEQPLDPVVI